MDSIYVISINLCNIWKEGVTAHFSEEHAEAPRGKKSLARGPASALAEPCFPHWLVGWTQVLEGPLAGVCVHSAHSLEPRLGGVGSTWRAAETEKPTRPGLRWALLSTAHRAATNTSPFPTSSRLAASHLRRDR